MKLLHAIDTTLNPREIIKKEYKNSKNFMTPDIIHYGTIATSEDYKIVYELSVGTDLDHNPLYGITVVLYDKFDHTTETQKKYSECFDSLEKAENHIKKLRRKFRK